MVFSEPYYPDWRPSEEDSRKAEEKLNEIINEFKKTSNYVCLPKDQYSRLIDLLNFVYMQFAYLSDNKSHHICTEISALFKEWGETAIW